MNFFNWFRSRRTLHCLIEPGGRGKYRWRVVDPSTLVARRAKKGEVVTPSAEDRGLGSGRRLLLSGGSRGGVQGVPGRENRHHSGLDLMLVYDIEIVKAILKSGETRQEDIEYCGGFGDHVNAGVSVICAYDWEIGRYRVFTAENFSEFEAMAQHRDLAGFNSMSFDDNVCSKSAYTQPRTNYDLLRECWMADGLGSVFEYPSHAGYGLDALAIANGLTGKTGHGADAPVDWQRGYYGKVIDYCLEDVRITAKLIHKVIAGDPLTSPKTGEPFKKSIRRPNYEPLPNIIP